MCTWAPEVWNIASRKVIFRFKLQAAEKSKFHAKSLFTLNVTLPSHFNLSFFYVDAVDVEFYLMWNVIHDGTLLLSNFRAIKVSDAKEIVLLF